MRIHRARLTCKGLGFSKDVLPHRAAVAWDGLVHDVARPLKTLRQRLADEAQRRWRPRIPATAAGLAGRTWRVGDILRAVPVPV